MSISFKILSYAERTASLFIGTGALVAGATTYRPEGSGTVDIFDTSLMIHLDAYLMRIDELLGSTNSSGLIDFLMTYPQHIQSEEFSQFFVQNGYGGFKYDGRWKALLPKIFKEAEIIDSSKTTWSELYKLKQETGKGS